MLSASLDSLTFHLRVALYVGKQYYETERGNRPLNSKTGRGTPRSKNNHDKKTKTLDQAKQNINQSQNALTSLFFLKKINFLFLKFDCAKLSGGSRGIG